MTIGDLVPQPENKGIVDIVPWRTNIYHHVGRNSVPAAQRHRGWPNLKSRAVLSDGDDADLFELCVRVQWGLPGENESAAHEA